MRQFFVFGIGLPALVLATGAVGLAQTLEPGVEALRWVSIGPSPITGGQIGVTLGTRPMSGRVATLAAHPNDPNRWLAGGAQGGVWETMNAGAIWAPRTDNKQSLAMGAIAYAKSNPMIIYAGTGESNFSSDSYCGAGILKSVDGGLTWTRPAGAKLSRGAFSDIIVDPSNANVVLASVGRCVFGRGDVPYPPNRPLFGVHKSTDGGATWSLKLSDGNQSASALAADPAAFNRQYAAIGDGGGTLNGAYRSMDAGNAWSLIAGPWVGAPPGAGRIELAIAPSNPNRVFVSVATYTGVMIGLFFTDNAWATTPVWTAISMTQIEPSGTLGFCGYNLALNLAANQCWYNHVLSVDPGNPNILYAGGIELWKYDLATDTWAEISHTVSNPAGGIHVEQHAMTWAGNRLIVGNGGGVWSSTDGGAVWADHNTNLVLTQFNYGSIHPNGGMLILGGSQDNGTVKWTGTNSWPQILGGHGGVSAISGTDPSNDWAVSLRGRIFRTTNGGASFELADSGIQGIGGSIPTRFEKCPTNDDVFLAGTGRVWRSNNFFSGASATWTDNNVGIWPPITVLAFTPASACSDYIFGMTGGLMAKVTGRFVNDLDFDSLVPARTITDFAFHPTNRNTLYVTLSGFNAQTPGGPGHVFKATNAFISGVLNWTNVSPPVDLPFNTVAVDPRNPNIVYVGADVGVWRSVNAGASWSFMGPATGMPNVAVFDIQAAGGRVVAFTHGRGAFRLINTLSEPPR